LDLKPKVAVVQALKDLGKQRGLKETDLRDFIKEQQELEREERNRQRQHEKIQQDKQREEQDKQRQHEKEMQVEKERMEKLRMSQMEHEREQ